MMPPLSEVVTRPEKARPNHGKTKHETDARKNAEVKHVSHTSRPEAGGPCEPEKRKSPETPVSLPARTSTPVVLKNKRQQPRTITDLGDIEAIVDIMIKKKSTSTFYKKPGSTKT
jgi:hypothetical protein